MHISQYQSRDGNRDCPVAEGQADTYSEREYKTLDLETTKSTGTAWSRAYKTHPSTGGVQYRVRYLTEPKPFPVNNGIEL